MDGGGAGDLLKTRRGRRACVLAATRYVSWCRVEGGGLRVEDLGFRVWGEG